MTVIWTVMMLYIIARNIIITVLKTIFGFEISGRQYVPKKGGFILACNHVSYLDPLVIGAACSRRLDFMARSDLFVNPLFSRILYNVGAFPVKRESADLSALKEALRRLKKGNALVVFPEGSRSVDGVLLSAQAGVGFLAQKAGVPIVPAFIKGTKQALPKGAKFVKPNRISVYFGEKIFVERRMPHQDIAQRVMENIRHLA